MERMYNQLPGWKRAEARIDGARLVYFEAGQGEPVLMLHGFPQDHRCWRHQVLTISRTYRVIAPDWLGWGESDRNSSLPLSYDIEVARLERFVSQLGLDTFNFIAHDYGGFIGLGFVIRNLKKIRRFAILNSRAHRIFRPSFYRMTAFQCWMARHPVTGALLKAMPLVALHRLALAQYTDGNLGCFSSELLEDYIGWMDTPEGRRWFVHYFAHYPMQARQDLDKGIESIKCPTAIIWGDRDPYIPFSTAEDLAKRIPQSTLTRINGASHFVMEERPEEVTTALVELLRRTVE